MADFDLIVIGSGPGGEKGAAQAAYFGKKVVLFEKERVLGGAAANTGTLPSKTLRETALVLSGIQQRRLGGIDIALKDRVNATDFMRHEKEVCEAERVRIRRNLERHRVEVIQATPALRDPQSVEFSARGKKETLKARKILIATGTSPHHPPVFNFPQNGIYDSDTILKLQDIPKSMTIVGGGVIGCEYACMFQVLGVEVTLVDGKETLLPFLDSQISELLLQRMKALGITMCLGANVEQVAKAADGFLITLSSKVVISSESILVASGRQGNTNGLGLDKVGITPNKRGLIDVNIHYQTVVPNIYAVGDVIGFPALASTSMEQGRVAMVHAFDLKYKSDLAPILPYGIYTIPECSMAGETEQALMEKKIPYVAGVAHYKDNARGKIVGEESGILKLLFHKETKALLGVHVLGEQSSELVHTGLVALLTKSTADLFIQTCFNYPTLTELYKYATYDALGKIV
ncbi:MAG: Si-specific NAD(P)(+) transhydrogenase [Deltaproteobacteria bacterium]|nr:Si-specific NAD(P)(+) transhydrogenase [Deltaproteobacteria bacterium]MBI3293937.1 Si-specific NAD(P)(+) transhydrogenase [Deltaproteobacteria bacterium]